jgi:hypothetical protein
MSHGWSDNLKMLLLIRLFQMLYGDLIIRKCDILHDGPENLTYVTILHMQNLDWPAYWTNNFSVDILKWLKSPYSWVCGQVSEKSVKTILADLVETK